MVGQGEELIDRQYAPVGAAGTAALDASVAVLEQAAARGLDVGGVARPHARAGGAPAPLQRRLRALLWPVNGLEDLRLAPFHVLAAESGAFAERDHAWHLEHCDALAAADPGWIRRTDRRFVDLTGPDARRRRSSGGRR